MPWNKVAFVAILLLAGCKSNKDEKSPDVISEKIPGKQTTVPISSAIPVTVSMQGMTRGGKPYFVKGVGGERNLQELVARGGNSIRTWSTKGLDKTLEEAERLGLTVSAGIWLENECSWFSYKNPQHCSKQMERVRKEVSMYRHFPALLAWGIGNEAEGDGNNADYWQQLDRLAVMVKEVDPNHPTFTAVAGLSPAKASGLLKFTPHLDYVGVNTYGAVFSLRKHLQNVGWNRPWLLTEWGPRGFWESKKTAFGAPLEQTSTEKADMMKKAYRDVITPDNGCLGNYAFVWGWKFEATSTWFGLYTHDGDTTGSVDALEEMWTGHKPANQAPQIESIKSIPSSPIAPRHQWQASARATDPDADPLQWHWAILPELQGHQHNGRKMPDAVAATIAKPHEQTVEITAPDKPGVYRLHVWVKDGKGHVATANTPFEVK